MALRSYYDVLEIEETATDTEIKRAYRRLAKVYHPDKNPTGAELFKEISHAYETLSDPNKRAAYDRFGERGGPDDMFDGFGMGDMGEGFFDPHMFADGDPAPRTESHPLNVTLEDMFRGKKMRVRLVRSIICKHCKGIGGRKSVLRECFTCTGRGVRMTSRQVAPGLFSQAQVVCSACNGSGKVVPDSHKCRKCKGSGTTDEKDTVEIHVEPGVRDGQKIVLGGKGDQRPGQQPQDLVFVLHQEPHSTFTRAGDDLSVKAQIDLAEALCGFSRTLLTHLDGRLMEVSHQSGVIKPDDVLCIRNKGMPQEKRPQNRGDLFIVFDIKFPDANWSPGPALKSLLPNTNWPKPMHDDSLQVETASGRTISSEAYEIRMRKQSQQSRDTNHGYGPEFGYPQEPGASCNQQ
ncbi:DnaJ-like protein xdj1 [Coemansia sp. RSA 988]|nr:DnaJ-like protein xdj1 [Coemansia sp. RSA 988]